jgi:cytochrome c biogenesis protein CcmG/thiol:disulfide interchange protein DsbE
MRQLTLLVATLLVSIQPGVASAEDPFDLTAYEGEVVVVDFWASWCVPCRRSFPWMNSMRDKYADDGLVIIAVNLDQERAEAEKFLAEFPPKFKIIYDETKDLAREFDVMAMPTSYLIGRDGEQIERHFGFKVKKQDEYESAIVAALGAEE